MLLLSVYSFNAFIFHFRTVFCSSDLFNYTDAELEHVRSLTDSFFSKITADFPAITCKIGEDPALLLKELAIFREGALITGLHLAEKPESAIVLDSVLKEILYEMSCLGKNNRYVTNISEFYGFVLEDAKTTDSMFSLLFKKAFYFCREFLQPEQQAAFLQELTKLHRILIEASDTISKLLGSADTDHQALVKEMQEKHLGFLEFIASLFLTIYAGMISEKDSDQSFEAHIDALGCIYLVQAVYEPVMVGHLILERKVFPKFDLNRVINTLNEQLLQGKERKVIIKDVAVICSDLLMDTLSENNDENLVQSYIPSIYRGILNICYTRLHFNQITPFEPHQLGSLFELCNRSFFQKWYIDPGILFDHSEIFEKRLDKLLKETLFIKNEGKKKVKCDLKSLNFFWKQNIQRMAVLSKKEKYKRGLNNFIKLYDLLRTCASTTNYKFSILYILYDRCLTSFNAISNASPDDKNEKPQLLCLLDRLVRILSNTVKELNEIKDIKQQKDSEKTQMIDRDSSWNLIEIFSRQYVENLSALYYIIFSEYIVSLGQTPKFDARLYLDAFMSLSVLEAIYNPIMIGNLVIRKGAIPAMYFYKISSLVRFYIKDFSSSDALVAKVTEDIMKEIKEEAPLAESREESLRLLDSFLPLLCNALITLNFKTRPDPAKLIKQFKTYDQLFLKPSAVSEFATRASMIADIMDPYKIEKKNGMEKIARFILIFLFLFLINEILFINFIKNRKLIKRKRKKRLQ